MDVSTFPQYGIFCDESSQTRHRFIVIGAICCAAPSVQIIRDAVELAIAPHGGTSELKWEKVKRKNLPMYVAVLDQVFSYINAGALHFYCLVIDTHKVNHAEFNNGDKEIGFNKFLFTLLFKFARVYRSNPRFYVLLDDRTTVHTPENMRAMLNARVRRDLHFGYDPYRHVRFRKSHEDRMIQLADLLTGAVASQTNGHHLVAGAAQHKIDAGRYICGLAKVPSLALPTRRIGGFDIWHLDFAQSKPRKGGFLRT